MRMRMRGFELRYREGERSPPVCGVLRKV